MGLNRNGKSERRGSAPLLISIFWLIATLGAVYIAAPEADLRNNRASAPVRDDARVAHENDNRSTPVQNSMRIAALEALHLKMKGGLRADASSHDGILPDGKALFLVGGTLTSSSEPGSSLALDRIGVFSARAPPATLA
ncbi:hypothetical protein [Phyllobacterium myrsinacearum]|uniref:Uncharacterized protein n=1 Tax=Phyllobacterium myrsinacearum TaxID=28101 RepID=A0A839EMA5_9HYPH|nr:hypothetical protein [Phyllobacterium myrsinacearum]MBA8878624.1 hypothetical protein [Phyllobacterium myrsinacearum]